MHEGLSIDELKQGIESCRICVEEPRQKHPLPHEPRPVCQLSSTAKICICGQAPGLRVHQSGRPFTDPSGDRLRAWMGVGEDVFYDASKIAIVPMGFCFPGYDDKGGDLPPRRECRDAWHDNVFAAMSNLKLILAIGQYAQAYHLGKHRHKNLTETVKNWQTIIGLNQSPRILPLPHPSWRNNSWIRKNLWFTDDLVPFLQKTVAEEI